MKKQIEVHEGLLEYQYTESNYDTELVIGEEKLDDILSHFTDYKVRLTIEVL